MTTYGKIGSISTGTLRCADLIATFASELESLVQSNAADWCSDTGRGTRDQLMALVGRARESLPDDNDHDADLEHGDDGTLDDYVNELTEALEYFAAPYTRFGAHYGDGADFGFWACIDDLEEACRDDEALRVADVGDVPDGYCGDVLFVNDHGNATYYTANHGELTEIWSVV